MTSRHVSSTVNRRHHLIGRTGSNGNQLRYSHEGMKSGGRFWFGRGGERGQTVTGASVDDGVRGQRGDVVELDVGVAAVETRARAQTLFWAFQHAADVRRDSAVVALWAPEVTGRKKKVSPVESE